MSTLFMRRRKDASIVKQQAGSAAAVLGQQHRALAAARQGWPSASQAIEIEGGKCVFQEDKLRFDGNPIVPGFKIARHGGFVASPEVGLNAMLR